MATRRTFLVNTAATAALARSASGANDRVRFAIIYASEVRRHVDAIEPKHHGLLRRAIGEHLTFAPGDPTRNRKPLDAARRDESEVERQFA